VLFFSQLTDYFGAKWVYATGISASVPCFSLFSVINYLARNSIERSGSGLGMDVWVAVWPQMWLSVLVSGLCYGMYTRLKTFGPPMGLIPFFVGAHLHHNRRT